MIRLIVISGALTAAALLLATGSRSQISNFRSPISNSKPPVSVPGIQTADLRSQNSDFRFQISDRKYDQSAQQPTAQQQPAGSQQPKLEGCVSCHGLIEPMHKYGSTEMLEHLKDGKDAVGLSCTACHGGNPGPRKTSDDPKEIDRIKREAHVRARFPDEWKRDGRSTGANPERSNTLLARESWEYVRFINPGDVRVAQRSCGSSDCHAVEQKGVARSMMTHGAMLCGAALYNNGGLPLKDGRFGESYNESG